MRICSRRRAGRSAWRALLTLGLVFVASTARAQDEPVVPPRAIALPAAPYPPSGQGDETVVVESVVDQDGKVVESRVIEGREPFARAALDTAPGWRFSPATRDGKPVRARVRVRVDFTPPPPPIASKGAAPATPRPPAPPTTTLIEEVTVHGTRGEPPHHEMTGSEVRQLPGSFGDAFRAIEALPGVVPIISGLPYYLVRGAPPGNTGFYIDGVRVPALFHLGVGEAVIHPGLVERVDLYPGVYPARFGRFTGGILSGEVREESARPHAEASVRLIDLGALATVPIDNGRGEVTVSGRYGYPGPVLHAVAAVLSPGSKIDLQYWDYQVRARWRTDAHNEVSTFIFGSFDALSATGTSLGVQFHRAELRWDHRTSPTGRLRLALTLGYDELSSSQTSQTEVFSRTNSDVVTTTNNTAIRSGLFALRTEWADQFGPTLDVRAGADATIEPYNVAVPGLSPVNGLSGQPDLGATVNAGQSVGFRQTDLSAGVYAELAWRPASTVELVPGVRADYFGEHYEYNPGRGSAGVVGQQARATVDPRASARWYATPWLAILSAAGVSHQPSNFPLPAPGLSLSQLSRGLQTAYQYSAGVEVKLPWNVTATADGFLHNYTGLADFYDVCPPPAQTCTFGGQDVGFELLVRRRLTASITGWLSYTLSRAERDSSYSPLSAFGAVLTPVRVRRLSEFDRTHVLNAIFAADLGKRWRAGLRFVAYSGLPYASRATGDPPPDSRGPPFFRLDVRIEKTWHALGGELTFVFEWLNAILQKESISTNCTSAYSYSAPAAVHCAPAEIPVPITFPSIGIEGAWGGP